jgi:hypothetical protein
LPILSSSIFLVPSLASFPCVTVLTLEPKFLLNAVFLLNTSSFVSSKITISLVPSKLTPLIFLAVVNLLADKTFFVASLVLSALPSPISALVVP